MAIPDAAYKQVGKAPWDSMTRLELYCNAKSANLMKQSITFRNIRFVVVGFRQLKRGYYCEAQSSGHEVERSNLTAAACADKCRLNALCTAYTTYENSACAKCLHYV